MRAIITGGGTVGHISPAVAIAEEILKKEPFSEVLFIVRAKGDENRLIINRGYPLKEIEIEGLNRKKPAKSLKLPYIVLKAYSKAKKIIKEFKPDIVIGTGGYVSLPVIKAANRLKIKTVLHESNAVLGLCSRLLYKGIDRLLLNIPVEDKRINDDSKTILVGTPVLPDFKKLSRIEARKLLGIRSNEFLILSFGGSGGALVLNESIIALSDNPPSSDKRIIHIHGTGKKYYDELKDKIKANQNSKYELRLIPYIDDMAKYILSADLVISRAGAITIAELASCGALAILIPSPNVTDNHQFKNAKVLSDKNAVILLEESELSAQRLQALIEELLVSSEKASALRKNIKSFSGLKSAERIYKEISSLLKK